MYVLSRKETVGRVLPVCKSLINGEKGGEERGGEAQGCQPFATNASRHKDKAVGTSKQQKLSLVLEG